VNQVSQKHAIRLPDESGTMSENGRLLAAASLVKCSGRRPTGLIQTAAASFSEIFP
jgi:hypothetical protein